MTINELQILLDLNQDNKTKILKDVASKIYCGYFFVDSEDGHCYLFDKDGNLDDINKIKKIKEQYIKKDIEKIVIPNSVKNIGDVAFYGCEKLKSIIIPNSVKNIGDSTFESCDNLISINIPNSIKSIGYAAFKSCINLTSINIPYSVKDIGAYAFNYCEKLTSINIPYSVKDIGYDTFYGCKSLTSIIFENRTIDQVKLIDDYPFGIKDESIIKCI